MPTFLTAFIGIILWGNAFASTAPNFIILIADDVGVESLPQLCQQESELTPNLSSLCHRSVQFTQAWSSPVCSPTRASLLTGRYGFRTGVGTVARGDIGLP